MTLRRGIFSRQSIFAIVNYASFIAKLQRHFQNAEVLRDADSPDSQNLRNVTRAWIKRLKEANVPEAEHSVKIITEHIVGKERLLVGMLCCWLQLFRERLSVACEQALLFGQKKRASRERASEGPRKGALPLAASPLARAFSRDLYFTGPNRRACSQARLSKEMCMRQSRKVIWDMINTLFVTTKAVEPTFVAFL